jgi:radical SAM superfamily enzyme YgiQ (UPF0313 family)
VIELVAAKKPVYAIHMNCDRPPIGLGMIISYLKKNLSQKEMDLLDFSPGYIVDMDDLESKVEKYGCGIFFFSTYLWNVSIHLEYSVKLKKRFNNSLIIYGGPFVPRDELSAIKFISDNPYIDILIHGEGEDASLSVIKRYLSQDNYENIDSITYCKNGQFFYNGAKSIDDIQKLPSPYLTGEFDAYLGLHDTQVVTLETTRGCPYKCAFCDWGQSTNQKIREFGMEKIYKELEWVGMNKIPIIELSDSNFGILKRDVQVAEYICKIKQKYGYPKEICANFAKNIHDNVISIIEMTKDAGLVSQAILSIQTLNPETLNIIGRKNLNEEHYKKSLERFRELDLPVTIELMLGLPGCTVQSFKNDLQWACDFNLGVYVHSTILIPNTQIASESFKSKYKILTAAESNLTNPENLKKVGLKSIKDNQVVSLESISQDEFIKMMKLTSVFHIFYGESIIKYLMFYLNNEYGITQIDFLYGLQENDLTEYPLLLKFRDMGDAPASTIAFSGDEDVLWETVRENRWSIFYDDVKKYILAHYEVLEEELEVVLEIQKFVMGYYNRALPDSREFEYNLPLYFKNIISGKEKKKLVEYGRCVLKVTDPLNICTKSIKPDYYEPHHGHIELSSQLNDLRFGFDLNDVKN